MAQASKDFADCFLGSRCLEPEEDILELLRSLEEVNEESFPYYTLVRWLRTSIENHLEDYSAERSNMSSAAWKAAARDAYSTIMESPEMVSLLEGIRNGYSPEGLIRDLSLLNVTPSESDTSSLDDVWWAPSILPQQYQQIADDISSKKPLPTRSNALKLFLGSHVTIEGPYWPQLRRGLREALCDENDTIFQLGLAIHVKLLSSADHFATKEAFVNLVESISTHFMSRKMLPNIPTIDTGLDLTKTLHFRTMKILQLIANAQIEISKEWVRFSPRKVEEMIECFIDLLSMHTYDGVSKEKYLYPFHLLSIIDHRSTWVFHWSHGIFSRNLLLRALARSSPLLRFATDSILRWMEDFDAVHYLHVKSGLDQIKNTPQSCSVPGHVVKYTVFTSSLYMLQPLLSYEAGRALFPVMQPNITLSSLAAVCVDFLNSHSDEINTLGPIMTKFICKFLPKLADLPLLLAVLYPILEAHADRGQEATYLIPAHTVCLVETLVGTEDGIRCLTGGRRPRGSFRHRSSQENIACLAKTLAEYLTAVLKSHRNADIRLMNAVLSICSAFWFTHDMLFYLESTGLFLALNHCYKSIKQKMEHEMFSTTKPSPYSYTPLFRQLLQCFLPILRTPKGFYYLESDGILHDVMQDLFEHSLVTWRRPEDRLLLSRACCYTSGALAVREERLVAEQLGRAWHGEEARDVLDVLTAVCVSLTSMQLQLDERPGSEETLLALCGPRSLSELLEAALLEEDESTQHVGLVLLARLVTNPDFALHLQCRIALQERLLQRQKENAVSPDAPVIVDELSVLRNHIIVQILVPGGPGERTLPPTTCDTLEFTLPLFGALPVPREYTRTSLRVVSSKRQQLSELQRFLADSRPGVHDAQWLLHCRRAAKASLQAQDEVKGAVLLDLVKQVLRASPNASILLGNLNADQSQPEEALGIAFAVRYGAQLRLIPATPQTQDNLRQLLRFSRTLRPIRSDRFTGFDWLVATVFLVLGGNIEKGNGFLQSLASLRWAPLIWSTFAERCRVRTKLEATVSHLLELLLAAEDPQLLIAFQRHGISAGHLFSGWLRRCFWGVQDWPGITQWLLLAILAEPDTVLYLGVAMLRHSRARLLTLDSPQVSLERFNVGEALPLVETLGRRHRHKVLPYLQAAFTASTSTSLMNLS